MSVFMVLLLIGVALPVVSLLFSLLFGSLEGLMGMLKFDIGHMDLQHDFQHDAQHDGGNGAGHFGLVSALIPMSPIVWCVQLAVMGCVGEMLSRAASINIAAIWVIAVIAGYTCTLIVNNCVMLPLKRVKNFADDADDMVGKQAEIIETILENGVGAVRVSSNSGSAIYAAKSAEGLKIDHGEKVIILEITDGRAVVRKMEDEVK